MQCQMHDQGNQVFFCWLNGLTHFCQRVNCKHNLAYSLKAWCRCRNNTFTASVSVTGPSQYQQYGSNAPSRNFGHCNKKFASAQTDSLCLQDLLEQHALWITEEKSVFDPKVEKIQSNGLKNRKLPQLLFSHWILLNSLDNLDTLKCQRKKACYAPMF